jgi:chromosome segregation ATPase
MRDSKSIVKLCEENPELDAHIKQLENQIRNYESFTARVYEPNKSYKELEEKVAQAEELRKKDIDELWETRITPLQNKIKDQHIQLESVYKRETRLTEEISHLKKVIDRLDTIVNYAAGYISACEQFRDKHPTDVIKWLFEGLKE